MYWQTQAKNKLGKSFLLLHYLACNHGKKA